MTISFKCPKCGTEMTLPDTYAGRTGTCKRCGTNIVAPGGETEAGAAVSAAPGASLPPKRTSRVAIASLVLAILGWFTCGLLALPGLILGIVSLSKTDRGRGQRAGRELAIAAICISGVMLVLLPMIVAILFPVFARARAAAKTADCLHNIGELNLAMLMHVEDSDGRFPSAEEWSDAISVHVKNESMFVCPEARDQRCGYAFNRALSGKSLADLRDPQRVVVLFESDLGWNGAGGPEDLPAAPRHWPGDVFAFADGSVKRIPREQQSELVWQPQWEGDASLEPMDE